MSCYVNWQDIRRGRKSLSICGEWTAERDISNEPTCQACRRELRLTADEVFGTEPPGTPVHHEPFDVFEGYVPKGPK